MCRNSMIKTIVFDVGDVLIDFRYEEYMRDLGFSEDVIRLFVENMILTEHWHQLDMGELDEADAPAHFSRLMPGHDREVRLFWEHIADIVAEYPEAGPLITDLKQAGYAVYLLSNYPPKLADLHWRVFTFLDQLDGMIISGREHITKPDPAIYRLLDSRYGLELSECLFIDDRDVNIEAAAALGMDTVLFTGYDALRTELARHLDHFSP